MTMPSGLMAIPRISHNDISRYRPFIDAAAAAISEAVMRIWNCNRSKLVAAAMLLRPRMMPAIEDRGQITDAGAQCQGRQQADDGARGGKTHPGKRRSEDEGRRQVMKSVQVAGDVNRLAGPEPADVVGVFDQRAARLARCHHIAHASPGGAQHAGEPDHPKDQAENEAAQIGRDPGPATAAFVMPFQQCLPKKHQTPKSPMAHTADRFSRTRAAGQT